MVSETILISFSLVFTKKLNACSVRSHFIDNSLLIGGFIAVTS